MAKNKPRVRFEPSEGINEVNNTIMNLAELMSDKADYYNLILKGVTVREKAALEQLWLEEVRDTIKNFLKAEGAYFHNDMGLMLNAKSFIIGRGGSHVWFKVYTDEGNYKLLFQFCFDSFY